MPANTLIGLRCVCCVAYAPPTVGRSNERRMAAFQRDGFVIVPNAVNARDLRRLRRAMRRALASVERAACRTAAVDDHNSVLPPTDTAAFQFEHDVLGRVRLPRRVHKIQGVGLISGDVVHLLQSGPLAKTAVQLSGSKDIDAFGTKFF